jgi:hypothetical protein
MRTRDQLANIAVGINRELKKSVADPTERRLILFLSLGIELALDLAFDVTDAAEEIIGNA